MYRNNNTLELPVFEQVDPRSPEPLYAQIAARIRVAIATRELAPTEALPSVRQLAAKLRVNPATVVQAYRDLETEGLVEMRQGTGTFVREVSPDRRSGERERHAGVLVRQMMADAARLGISPREIADALEHELGVKTR